MLAYDDVGGTFTGVLAPQSGYARLAAGETVVWPTRGGAPAHPFERPRPCRLRLLRDECRSSSRSSPIAARPPTRPAIGMSSPAPPPRIRRSPSRICPRPGSSKRRGMSRAASCSGLRAPRMSSTRLPRTITRVSVRISHDGYRDRFGYIHRRRLTLRKSGLSLEGHDQLSAAEQRQRS